MDAQLRKLQKERREQFAKMYKETFGVEPDFEKEDENTETVIVLNFYGVKCNWM